VLGEYLRATPDPARALLKQIAAGASPRQMVNGGVASPSLMEDLLSDLAVRCAIRTVEAEDGTDLLSPAVAQALANLQRKLSTSLSEPPNARPSASPPPPLAPQPARTISPEAAAVRPATVVQPERPSEVFTPSESPAPSRRVEEESRRLSRPISVYRGAEASDPVGAPSLDGQGAAPPSSLEDAVMRELSDRSPAPVEAWSMGTDLPPIIEPSALRPRSSNPPAEFDHGERPEDHSSLPSFPPDAMVPETSSADNLVVSHGGRRSPGGIRVADVPGGRRDVAERASAAHALSATRPSSAPRLELVEETPRWRGPWAFVVAFALLGGAVVAALRAGESDAESSEHDAVALVPLAARTQRPAPSTVTVDDLPPGIEVSPGDGYIEIAAPSGAEVDVDGKVAPPAIALPAGLHEVRAHQGGRESKVVVDVRAGKMGHVNLPPLLP
ncbi:MAG: hypothetical protein ACREJ3_12840, partial [Polyangiaceae bacterium]